MRLINTETYEIKEFSSTKEAPYAILSHTWGEEEVSFNHMQDIDTARGMKGFKKIEYCCRQAKTEGLRWAWVDTCCIDKTSSAELSEAINSMFAWYSDSATCYAYLEDVQTVKSLERAYRAGKKPRWFTRGWTLQELIAPMHVEFYSGDWEFLGSRSEHQELIAGLTSIDPDILNGMVNLDEVPVATRMSWASRRKTTRVEDESYCLLGIFGVNMPLLYGEGPKAFQRLLREILETIEDQTVFLWGYPQRRSVVFPPEGFLAKSPHDYRSYIPSSPVFSDFDPELRVTTGGRGIRITARIIRIRDFEGLEEYGRIRDLRPNDRDDLWLMGIPCSLRDERSRNELKSDNPRLVTLVVKSSVDESTGTVTMSRCGAIYLGVDQNQIQTWPVSTQYLQTITNSYEMDFKRVPAIWRPASLFTKHHVTQLKCLRNLSNEPGAFGYYLFRARLLEHSSSSDWLLVSMGLQMRTDLAFCDIWVLPKSIRFKIKDSVDNMRGARPHGFCAKALWSARKTALQISNSALTWKRRTRESGPWTKATCQLRGKFEVTAVLTNALELHLFSKTITVQRFTAIPGSQHKLDSVCIESVFDQACLEYDDGDFSSEDESGSEIWSDSEND